MEASSIMQRRSWADILADILDEKQPGKRETADHAEGHEQQVELTAETAAGTSEQEQPQECFLSMVPT